MPIVESKMPIISIQIEKKIEKNHQYKSFACMHRNCDQIDNFQFCDAKFLSCSQTIKYKCFNSIINAKAQNIVTAITKFCFKIPKFGILFQNF